MVDVWDRALEGLHIGKHPVFDRPQRGELLFVNVVEALFEVGAIEDVAGRFLAPRLFQAVALGVFSDLVTMGLNIWAKDCRGCRPCLGADVLAHGGRVDCDIVPPVIVSMGPDAVANVGNPRSSFAFAPTGVIRVDPLRQQHSEVAFGKLLDFLRRAWGGGLIHKRPALPITALNSPTGFRKIV